MAASLRFKVNGPSGGSSVFSMPDTELWGAAKAEIAAKVPGLGAGAKFRLVSRMGKAEVASTDSDDTATIGSLGFEARQQYDAVVDAPGAAGAAGAGAGEAASGAAGSGGAATGGAAPMKRIIVPADNTCLFTAVGYLLMGRTKELGPDLRELCAGMVATSDFPEGALDGKSPAAYAAWLRDKSHWGGAIEVGLLAEHFGRTIVVIEVKSGIAYPFGSGDKCVYLVNDGIHYDGLGRDASGSGREADLQVEFDTADAAAKAEALAAGAELKAARAFVDTATFALLCTVCNTPLRGEKEAREHASKTGHVNFVQNK
ncbi:hypothetical protein FNF29_07560 [Cafeteria roenbergensis]|uniref:Ubiquitin thioesterase OTU n=1 Tax=Cafeteria roenbergensis TaxID=33653 RepID=A0A5A8C2M9_CAFRO|nr:hypothetical protein FNF29_07560 [Cafeteria roenbergensis]|eukprot:KAA0147188.1 hypothetical protein FNF29_07560 [Cafeteria roenbergensis]